MDFSIEIFIGDFVLIEFECLILFDWVSVFFVSWGRFGERQYQRLSYRERERFG